MQYPAFGLSGFSASLENQTDQSPGNETYTAAQSMSVPKISATQQKLRPLQFQERTFTAPLIIHFDTFNQTIFVAAFWNGKAGNLDRHHLLTKSLGEKAVRSEATKSDNGHVASCRFRSSKVVAFCRSKLSLLVA